MALPWMTSGVAGVDEEEQKLPFAIPSRKQVFGEEDAPPIATPPAPATAERRPLFNLPSREEIFGSENRNPALPAPATAEPPKSNDRITQPATLMAEPEAERPRPVAEEKGFLRGSVEAVRRGVDEMRAAKRLGRAVAGIDPDTAGFVEEIPSGLKNLADSTGRLSGGPEAVRRRLSPDQQAVLDREAAAYADLKRRNEENPLVDPESGFFKRGWFSGLNSVAGWIANMAAGADEAAAGAATSAGLALLAGQAGPQAALPEEVVTVPGALLAGAARGLTLGSAKEWYFQGLGDSYADMVRNGIAPEAARDVASVMAVPYAAIEFLSGYLPGIRGMVRVGEGALRRVAAPQTAKSVLKSAFLRTLFNAPVEMGEEAGQSAVNDLAYNLAAKISNAENGTAVERRSTEEILRRAWTDFYESTVPVLMMGFGGGAVSTPGSIRSAGNFRRMREAFPPALQAAGVRPDIAQELSRAMDADQWNEIMGNRATDIDADVAVAKGFAGYDDRQASDLLARLKAKHPEHRDVQPLDSADPRDAIRAIVEIQRGLAPGALRRPTATMRPTATAQPPPAKPDPTAGVTYGSEEDQSRRDELVQTPEQFEAEIDRIVAYFDAQEAAKAATTTTPTPAAENAPTGQPAAQPPPLSAPQAPAVSGPPSGPAPMPASPAAPAGQAVRPPPGTPPADRGAAPSSVVASEPPAGETQAGLSPTGETQPISASGTIPTEITQGQAPIAPPDTDRRTVLQETGDREQETAIPVSWEDSSAEDQRNARNREINRRKGVVSVTKKQGDAESATVKESLTLAKPAKLAPLRKGQAVRFKGQEYFVSGMPRLLKKQGIVEITRKGGSEPKAVRADVLERIPDTGDGGQGRPEARGQRPKVRRAGEQAEQPVVTDTPDGVKVEVPMSAKAEAKVTPKEQKKYFIDQIDAAIDSATDLVPTRKNRKDATLESAAEDFRANAEEIGTVEIEVPGDGTFTLLNTKDALRKLKARAAAMFPATPPTASAPSKPSGKPSAIAKVGPRPGAAMKLAWVKLLDPFTVKDKNPTPKRATMVTPLFNPAHNETVATDSSRLVVALGVKIGTPIQEGGPQYSYVVPGYRQNQLPKKQNDQQTVRVADTEQFIRQIRQAKMATEKRKDGPDTIGLYAMPDGSVAVASMYHGDGYVSQDVSNGTMIGAYTADFVDEIVTFLRKTGNQAIEIRHRDEESPLVLLGSKEYAVLMPVRGTELNAPDALAGMVPETEPARFAARQPEDALIFRKELAGSPAESRMEAGYGTAGENEAGMAGRQDGGQLPAGAAAGYAGRDALPFGDRDGRQGALPDQERREVQAPARLGREIAEAEDTAAEIERHRAGTYAANFADAEPAPEYADTPEAQDAAAMLKAHGVERVHAVRGMKSLAVRMPDGTVFLDESLGAGSTGTALHELVHKWKREGNQKVKRIENAFQRSTAAAKRFILKLADSVESAIGNRADAVEYAEKHAAEEATAIVLDLMAKRGGKSALGLEKSDILAAFGGMAKQVENMARALADKAQAAKLAYLDGKAEQAAPEADATDRAYLAAVERGDMETAQRIVDEAAKAAGYNVGPVWHGGAAGFNVFDWSKMGQQGTSEGKGFYFTNDRDLAKGYADRHGGRLMRVYLRGGERIDGHKLTFTVSQVKRILTDVHNRSEAQEEGSSPLWNYGDIGYEGKSAVIDKAARDTVKYSKDDVSLLAGLINGGADPESLYDSVYRVTGKTGIVEQDAWSRPGHEVHIATSASHVKLADPITRDDTGRIIPPSERFNPQSDDIRYAASRPPAASEWDGAKVEQYKRKDGAVRFKVVVDGKSRRAGFGSAENAERYLTEQKARLEDDYAAVIRRTKASVADIAEARRKLTIELSNEKAVAADVVNSLFKAMTRLDIMTPVHRKEIAAEIKRTAQERKADPEGWAKRTTEKVWQIASRISYMKELNDIFDKKQPVVTENKTLQAKPKYDAFVNRWIAKAKEYAELTPEEVNQRIEAIDADQNNRLANRGEEMAEELDDSVRERHLLSTFGGLFHGADYARAKAAFEAAKDLVTEGRERFMEMENHRKMQAAAKRQQIIEEAKGGRQIDGNELEMETRNKSIWELLSSAGNWLHSKVLSGPYLYNQAADTRKGVDDMSGEAVRQYEGEVRAIEDEERLNEIVREDLTGIMADAMGLADPAKNRAEAAKFSKILHGWRKKQKATGIFLHRAVRNARGDLIRIEQGSELRNSQTKLLTMFLIAKRAESAAKQRFTNEPVEIEGGFNSIMEALVHNGYTAETIAQIEKNLDPRLIKIGWKMLEYMRDHSRPEVEKVTFRLLGAVPPMYGEWYFPMDRANDKRNVAGGRNAYTLVQGFMKMLTPNKLDFRPVDAFERFLSHFDDLNHVVSHIEIVDQQNRIFNHPDMQKTLRVYRGDAMRKAVNNHLDRLTLGGEAGMAASVLRWFRSMFARSVIPNPTQTPKQMSSMILFSTRELPPGANLMDWFLGVGKAIASPRDALRFDAELNKYCVRWRERYGHGYNQQVREARRGATARDLLGKKMAWFEFMNAFPQAGDKISSLIGGRPIYDLWYKHFTEVEKNPPMVAREKAMRKFMDAVELTQQSGALPHLSDSQVGFAANFMMFKTQPTAMTRLWMNSVRNLAMKRGSVRDNVWNMVAVMIGQMAFQAAADAFFVAAFDDPDEWKRLSHNQVRAALFAPINGYLVLPEALLRLTKIAMKDKVYGEFAGDVSSYLDVVNDIENVVKMFMKEEEMDGNDWMDVAQGVGSIGGAFTGKPIAPTVRWGRGIYDAVTDPTLSTPGRIARGVGYGKQAAGQDKPRKTSASSSPYPWESPAARSPYAKMPWER